MDKRAIGVFDSGLGGITAVREMKKLMPNEDIIYFGDTSRVPYGTKTKETIKKYATQDIRFLQSKNVKIIVAACGTVSANPPDIIESLGLDYTGVLIPAVKAAITATKNQRVGIIATQATIKSGAYNNHLAQFAPQIQAFSKACPMFVPLVENGYTDEFNPITRAIAEEYLADIIKNEVDTLILGCTHYPIIERTLSHIVGKQVTLIDPGKETAKTVFSRLKEKALLNETQHCGKTHFYVSDDKESFAHNASVFLHDDITSKVEKINIEEY